MQACLCIHGEETVKAEIKRIDETQAEERSLGGALAQGAAGGAAGAVAGALTQQALAKLGSLGKPKAPKE